MIVYGEILFLENMITGGVLLYVTSEIFGIEVETMKSRIRFIAGSVMCGLFSMVIFLNPGITVRMIFEAAFATLLCVIVFGPGRLIIKSIVFILVTYFMGGITMGLLFATGQNGIYTGMGIYTGDMKAGVLALFTVMFIATSKQAVKIIRTKKFYSENVFIAEIFSCGQNVTVKAFLDTGNNLKDPVRGSPVAVADEKLWSILDSQGFIKAERICLIPYEAIGSGGLLTGIRVDYVKLSEYFGKCTDKYIIKSCVIAKGDKYIRSERQCEANTYNLLLSKNMRRGCL